MTKYNFDCLHFKGYKPCKPKKLCAGCGDYAPWEQKILIIKLGALGDVLRTTPVLHAFKRKYPRSHITWVTKQNAKDMLSPTPFIDRLLFIDDKDNGTALRLMVEEFDEIHNYDKEDAAIALCSLVKAKNKFGFYLNKQGQMAPLNEGAVYSFDLGLSDPLKFDVNQKTYQDLTYETSGLPIPAMMDPYVLPLSPSDLDAGKAVLRGLGWQRGASRPIIGLNTGSGRVFRTKQWSEESFLELAIMLKKNLNAQILLLGGSDEDARNAKLADQLRGIAHYPGCHFTIKQFAGLLGFCDAIVTGDTLAMHLALAMKIPPVVLFGPTCPQEVDLYGMGQKIISKPACAPCYKNECDQVDAMRCMKDISHIQVYGAVAEILKRSESGSCGLSSGL